MKFGKSRTFLFTKFEYFVLIDDLSEFNAKVVIECAALLIWDNATEDNFEDSWATGLKTYQELSTKLTWSSAIASL